MTRFLAVGFLLLGSLPAQVALPDAKPVLRMQAVPQPYHQISFQRDGHEIVRYHFGPELHRPFLFPLVGPSGRVLTRMGHPHDPEGHSHHNSVWISHHDVGGVDFWSDGDAGRIVHERVEWLEDGQDSADVIARNAWKVNDGRVLLSERRRIHVQSLPREEYLLIIELTLEAKDSAVTLGKTPFGMLGVRMAKSIGVHDGGGMIRNSEGGVNEAGVLWKRAKWVDYSGPAAPGVFEGITLLDHPANPNHPTFFHVRDDGWMGASLTYDAPRTIKPGNPLTLRYGLYVHRGVPTAGVLEKRWAEFSRIQLTESKR
jgi:hypothetical protein